MESPLTREQAERHRRSKELPANQCFPSAGLPLLRLSQVTIRGRAKTAAGFVRRHFGNRRFGRDEFTFRLAPPPTFPHENWSVLRGRKTSSPYWKPDSWQLMDVKDVRRVRLRPRASPRRPLPRNLKIRRTDWSHERPGNAPSTSYWKTHIIVAWAQPPCHNYGCAP